MGQQGTFIPVIPLLLQGKACHHYYQASFYPIAQMDQKAFSRVCTVKPLNNGDVHYREFVHCSEVKNILALCGIWDLENSFIRRLLLLCSIFRVSIIRGSTVQLTLNSVWNLYPRYNFNLRNIKVFVSLPFLMESYSLFHLSRPYYSR